MKEHNETQAELGRALREAREVKGLSLREAAGAAGISPTYLNHLEAAKVKEPSPHVLRRLAAAYNTSYAHLMELAGYVMPDDNSSLHHSATGPMDVALRSSVPLTDIERKALLEYLAFLRFRSKQGQPPDPSRNSD